MPLADFKCTKPGCDTIKEEYYHTRAQMFAEQPSIKCPVCASPMKRMPSLTVVGREVPGYEKKNRGKLTIGKAVDSRGSKWI